MRTHKALASVAALGLVLAGVAAAPAIAQDGDDAAFWTDTGALLTTGMIAANILVVTIWATEEDDIQIIPDPEPTPVSP